MYMYNICDCWMCVMTEEDQALWDEGFVEWEYQNYCEKTKHPLSMDEWLQSLPDVKPKKK